MKKVNTILKLINLASLGKENSQSSFFTLFGEVNDDSAQNAVSWILEANYADEPPEDLTMLINSEGGSLSAAFAIIDMMRGSRIPVRTIGLGQIASAGLLIFMSGHKGSRILSPNTSIMSHQYFWGAADKYHGLIAVRKEQDLTQERLIKHISKCTGLDSKKINKELMPPHDVWLSPDEAKKFGICDCVKELK